MPGPAVFAVVAEERRKSGVCEGEGVSERGVWMWVVDDGVKDREEWRIALRVAAPPAGVGSATAGGGVWLVDVVVGRESGAAAVARDLRAPPNGLPVAEGPDMTGDLATFSGSGGGGGVCGRAALKAARSSRTSLA